MEPSQVLRVHHIPELRQPVLLAAFAGWNDAAQVATSALQSLRLAWNAEPFVDVDPEPFFVFTEVRPMISLTAEGQRDLTWPANEAFAYLAAEADRDVVLLIGTEPQLRWRGFAEAVMQIADLCGASTLVTLGGLLADVPHTVAPRLSGFATSPELLPRLQELGVHLSTYEGPTGIIGVLHDAWRRSQRPAMSLWGNVPHYISAAPNPPVMLALLERLQSLLGFELPLGPLERKAGLFRQQVDEALSENPNAQEYVRRLEQNLMAEGSEPLAPELMSQLKEFLRSRRPGDDRPDA